MTPPFSEYVQAGLSVIPIRADGSKAAAVAWKPFCERLPTMEEAGNWERSFEGIAIIGGAVSGNLEILDIDEPTLARPYFEALRAQDPALYPKLSLIRTPRRNESGQGGCHAVYRCETPIGGNVKLAMSEPEPAFHADGTPIHDPSTGKQKTAPRTLIETRGEGGYAITVGSSGKCHPTGNEYEHVGGPGLTELATLTATERATIHRTARMFDRSVAETHHEPRLRGYERAKDGESPGDAFNARTNWAEILEPHGWTLVGESGGVKRWRRPGKASGISATTGILSKAGNELLTVFSTNAHPFEGVSDTGRAGVTYSKFAAHAILNHGGDFETAAKALVRLGYGTPSKKTEHPARVLCETAKNAELRYLELLEAGRVELVSLGLKPLDDAIGGGCEPGEMVVIGGLTSHGKSVCGLQALRATVEAEKHAVLVSHEMGSLTIAKRLLQARVPIDTRHWSERTADLRADSEGYWAAVGRLFILEQCRAIDQIEKEIDRIAAEFDLRMIVIDHAQLTAGKGATRYEQLTDASGRFKALAVKHDAVSVVLSQLNREAAKSDNAESHHLRESGALEQDADVVLLVRWPWKAKPDTADPAEYEFRIVKNRNRPIVNWRVTASFNPARQTITEPVPGFADAWGDDWGE